MDNSLLKSHQIDEGNKTQAMDFHPHIPDHIEYHNPQVLEQINPQCLLIVVQFVVPQPQQIIWDPYHHYSFA